MRSFQKIINEDFKNISSHSLPFNNFNNKTFLITGANGMIASFFIKNLLYLNKVLNLNLKIIGLVRNITKAKKIFKQELKTQSFKLFLSDLAKPPKIKDKINIIIHSASQASPKYYGIDPVGTIIPNSIGSYYLLELAKINKVNDYLFISSSEVYGEIKNQPIKETDFGSLNHFKIRSCYAESKKIGETLALSYFTQYQVPIKIVRLFHTYGPGLELDDGRVFADFVSNIINNQNIVLNSDGKAKRTFCYLTDTILGIFTVLLKGKSGEIYNIGNEKAEISISNLAITLIKMFPQKHLNLIINNQVKKGYIRSQINRNCPDTSKLRKLGWIPKVSISEGFRRTIESYL